MGIRERIVVELVCDLCGKQIEGEPGRTGSLEARTTGARGRGERHLVAFHEACYARLVGAATKPAPTRRPRPATPAASPDGASPKPTRARRATGGRKATAKRIRRRRASSETS